MELEQGAIRIVFKKKNLRIIINFFDQMEITFLCRPLYFFDGKTQIFFCFNFYFPIFHFTFHTIQSDINTRIVPGLERLSF